MGNIKYEIGKIYENEYKSNIENIKNFDSKISLFYKCSKDNKNLLRVIYTLGTSIVISLLLKVIGGMPYEYASILCLVSSTTIGSVMTTIETKKYKKKINSFSLATTRKQIDEEMIRYCIEKTKFYNQNVVNKQIYDDVLSNKAYQITDKFCYRPIEEVEEEIEYEGKKIKEKEQGLDIISSKKTIDNELGYDKLDKYIKTTILSLIGIFSICYLPNIGLNMYEVLLSSIKISLIANVPLNIFVIKGLIEDKGLYDKLNSEINKKNIVYKLNLSDKIDFEQQKLIKEICANKMQHTYDEFRLSNIKNSTKQDNTYYKSDENNIKEKNKVLLLK